MKRLQDTNQSTVQPQGSLSHHSHGCLSDLFQKPSKDGDSTFSSFCLSKALPILLPERFLLTSHPQSSSSCLTSVFLSYPTWAKLFLSPFQRSFYNTRHIVYPLHLLFWQNQCFPSDSSPYAAVSWPLLKPSACLSIISSRSKAFLKNTSKIVLIIDWANCSGNLTAYHHEVLLHVGNK